MEVPIILLIWNLAFITGTSASVNLFPTEIQFKGRDATVEVFKKGTEAEVFPVAYYDINGDKLTDIIGVSKDRTSLNIFLAYTEPPFLRKAFNSQAISNKKIASVRPCDFTGDGLADLMITLEGDDKVEVVFCRIDFPWMNQPPTFQCEGPGSGGKIGDLVQEPSVLDLNGDMALDLIGERWIERGNQSVKKRFIWLSMFSSRESFEWKAEEFNLPEVKDMLSVSSNAFADIDGDGIPELMIITEDNSKEKSYFMETFEILKDVNEKVRFRFKRTPEKIQAPQNKTEVLGQPIIIDFEHTGNLSYLLPYCIDEACKTSGIFILEGNEAIPLIIDGMSYEGMNWGFVPPTSKVSDMNGFYSKTVTFRVGDYNLDGYPDLLGVLQADKDSKLITRAVLFENVVCSPSPNNPCVFTRTFSPNFEIFKDYVNVISSTFYDISDDGVLDIILVAKENQVELISPTNQNFVTHAFKNEMNFDSSFLKVMVLIGQQCAQCESGIPYGNVLPGATVKYTSLNSKGTEERGTVAQTYRTSHMPLDLPCEIFGIGHSPNFIEKLEVVISPSAREVYRKTWLQIIPNSQVVVVPNPVNIPGRWIMKLFLTPSDIVLKTFGILVAICAIFGTLVGILEFKERREDRLVRQSEAHRLIMY